MGLAGRRRCFYHPGDGPVLIARTVVASIAGALEGTTVVSGPGAIGAGLYSIGIPRIRIVFSKTNLGSNPTSSFWRTAVSESLPKPNTSYQPRTLIQWMYT